MVRRVVKVRLDGDLLTGFVLSVAATMGAIEMINDGAPCQGIALLICKTADGAGDHAVDRGLVVVGVRPPGTYPIPGHCHRSVRPSYSWCCELDAGFGAAGLSSSGGKV